MWGGAPLRPPLIIPVEILSKPTDFVSSNCDRINIIGKRPHVKCWRWVMRSLLAPRYFPKLLAMLVLVITGLLLAGGAQSTSADIAPTRDPRQPLPTQRPRASSTPRSAATSRPAVLSPQPTRVLRTGTAGFRLRSSTPISAQGAPTATALAV